MIKVTFGPTPTPALSRAVSFATAHADELCNPEPKVYEATFRLQNQQSYGAALQLLFMVGSWKTTLVEIDDGIEPARIARAMLACARDWLRTTGRCQAIFWSPRGWPKCRACPLYSAQWAAESAARPNPYFMGPAGSLSIEIPDHLPDEWDD